MTSRTPDEVVPDTSYHESVQQMFDFPHTADDDRDSRTCAHSIEDEKLKYTTHANNTLLSFDNQDYIEKIEEFQFCVDTVVSLLFPFVLSMLCTLPASLWFAVKSSVFAVISLTTIWFPFLISPRCNLVLIHFSFFVVTYCTYICFPQFIFPFGLISCSSWFHGSFAQSNMVRAGEENCKTSLFARNAERSFKLNVLPCQDALCNIFQAIYPSFALKKENKQTRYAL